jgi:hypothetical protein
MNGIMMTPTTGTFLCARPIEQPTIGLDNAELVIHSAKYVREHAKDPWGLNNVNVNNPALSIHCA